MSERTYTLQEAATELGWEYERLKTKARRNEFPTVDIPYGNKRLKKGITQATLDRLGQQNQKDTYPELVELFFYEMRTGTWGKGGRPLSEGWMELQAFYLNRYWTILGVKPSILGVNVENFKKVMASFEIDREAKRDFYSAKMHIYKTITGFMKLLVREGYKKREDLEAVRENLPGKVFSLKKDFLDLKDIEEALRINQKWSNGRSLFDRQAFHTLLSIYAYAGLRKMEAAYLRVDQVHLQKGYLHVYGKWATERIVPIFPALMETLTHWLKARENWLRSQGITSEYLLPQMDGSALTDSAIANRFKRFKAHIKTEAPKSQAVQITPHALRRSCATIATINGMPDGLIQKMLGHKHASTTEGYKMTQDRHLVEWAQTFYFGGSSPATPNIPPVAEMPPEPEPVLVPSHPPKPQPVPQSTFW